MKILNWNEELPVFIDYWTEQVYQSKRPRKNDDAVVYSHKSVPLETPVRPLSSIFRSDIFKIDGYSPTLTFKKRDDVPEGFYVDGYRHIHDLKFEESQGVAFEHLNDPSDNRLVYFCDLEGKPFDVALSIWSRGGSSRLFNQFATHRMVRVRADSVIVPFYSLKDVDFAEDPVIKPFEGFLIKEGIELCPLLGTFTAYFQIRPQLADKLSSPWSFRLALFCPKQSVVDQTQIAIYQNKEKREADISTRMKPGKAFKKMFPEASDKDVEQFVDLFRLAHPTQELEIHSGKDRADFRHMYTHDICQTENVRTNFMRKSLANSCMRYNHWAVHPSEAYASGDFSAFWTENPDGLIGSRVVVCEKDKTWGPIYGTTELSVSMLEEHLSNLGYKSGHECEDWGSARMLKINYRGNSDNVVFPYIDFGYGPIQEDGDFLVLGEIDDLPTEGWCRIGGCYSHCCNCGSDLSEDEVYSSRYGDSYCEECYYQEFGTCEHLGEDFPREELVECFFTSRSWTDSVLIHRDYTDSAGYVFCESRDKYWRDSECVCLNEDGHYEHINDTFFSDLTCKYHRDYECEEGEDDKGNHIKATSEEFEDEGYEFDSARGLYVIPQKEEEAA